MALSEVSVILEGVYLRPAADQGAVNAMHFVTKELRPLFCLHRCEPNEAVRFTSIGLIRLASSKDISCQSCVPQDCKVLAWVSHRILTYAVPG